MSCSAVGLKVASIRAVAVDEKRKENVPLSRPDAFCFSEQEVFDVHKVLGLSLERSEESRGEHRVFNGLSPEVCLLPLPRTPLR
jgi:hypothetical protein